MDSKNDLNVYRTAAEDKPSTSGIDAIREEQDALSCCSAETRKTCCKLDEKESCCGTKTSTCACQTRTSSMGDEAKTMASRLDIRDLNEWAGKYTGHLAGRRSSSNHLQARSMCMLSSPRRSEDMVGIWSGRRSEAEAFAKHMANESNQCCSIAGISILFRITQQF